MHFPAFPLRCGLVLATVAGTLAWAADTEVANSRVVELPKFVVTDSRDLPAPESWRYATFPGFEILSNASDRATQRLIRDFRLFRDALDVVWRMPQDMNTPVLLILCGRGGKFDAFVPAHTEGSPETAKASLFLQGQARTAIVIDLESSVINLSSLEQDDPGSGVDSSQFSVEHNKQLYREYVRYLLSRSQPRLPAWFEEGMAQIVMAMRFDSKLIEFGKLEDPNTVSAQAAMTAQLNAAATDQGFDVEPLPGAPAEDRDFNAALSHRALIPLAKFFAVDHNAPEAMNPLGNNRWAKQAYAFVHLGLYGENDRWQKPFMQFLIRSTREPVTEALFRDCFKMSYKDMQLQLRGYIEFTSYRSKEYRLSGEGLGTPAALALRDATQSEVGRIKGQALTLGGHAAEARREFIAPYLRGERDPRLLAALGLAEQADGKEDRARQFLTAATDGKADDPAAYLALARMRFAEAVASPGGRDHTFSAAQLAGIRSLLLTARTLPPRDPAVYDLLAQTIAHEAGKPQRDEVAPLIEGVRAFPGHLKLVFQTAAISADAGLLDAAASLIEHGLKFAPDAATRAKFEQLKAALPKPAEGTTTKPDASAK